MSAIAKLGGIGLMRKYLGYSAGKCDEWWDERYKLPVRHKFGHKKRLAHAG
jgi:hypothetical protein